MAWLFPAAIAGGYREERLQVRRRGGRKRALGTRAPMTIPQSGNQRWSLDFVSDAFACGRRFRIFAVVDDFTRECVRLIADILISGLRVARELDWAIAERHLPPRLIFGEFKQQQRVATEQQNRSIRRDISQPCICQDNSEIIRSNGSISNYSHSSLA
tara:strand:+ start:41337 stop:41810 length:474 start_codon:yes stop_codon:yes gene_type:complete